MKKLLHLFSTILITISIQVNAQEPILTQKNELQTTLLSDKTFNLSNTIETISIPIETSKNMSLEIKAKINSATGRGLDIDLRRNDFKGFRNSLNTEKLQWSAPLLSSYSLNFSSTEEQIIRYAIEGDIVHIYQNGTYVESKNLTTIYDLINGIENTNPTISDMVKGPNILENAFGNLTTQTPLQAGWNNDKGAAVRWNIPNSSGVRFANTLNGLLTYNGSAYTNNNYFMVLRWDSIETNFSTYSYPVTLEANKTYNLSSMYSYYSNNNNDAGAFKIAVIKETAPNIIINQFSNSSLGNGDKRKLYDNDLTFTTTEAGTYYLLFQNNGGGVWLLGNLILKEFDSPPRIIVGKNYPEGDTNMQITSITFDSTGSYAPILNADPPKIPITLASQDYSIIRFINSEVTVSGKSNVHITETNPISNSTINLTSDNSWLYLESIKPSEFLDTNKKWLNSVTINGQKFDATKDRVAIYGSGCVIIPNGKITSQQALTVYTEENFAGDSKSLEIETYHNNLDAFDNKIKSFKLKKGYSATFANNPDGTGFSKMYIASDDDIEIATLPEGFVATATDKSSFVSFIRVFKWEWTSKKGIAGPLYGENDSKAGASIVYDWDAGGSTENIDAVYTPMRYNLQWDSFSTINSRNNVSHVLGYNEPERTDQSNVSVSDAIGQWPELFKSGLRIGSPAPATIPMEWLTQFMYICDLLNYRVDFVAFHAYQDLPTSWWASNIASASIGGRPVWLTEWNNGAAWTNAADKSKWADPTGIKVDVTGKPILDSSGNFRTVDLPLTPANAEIQKNKVEVMLNYFESNDLLEHQFIYNLVDDARMIELYGQLTPAGEAFGKFKSKVGFKKSKEYNFKWTIAPPWLNKKLSDDYTKMHFSWYDHNGETGKKYIIERKTDANYVVIGTLVNNVDYVTSKTVDFTDDIQNVTATYRVKAISYKGTESRYSIEVVVPRVEPAKAPTLTGKVISSTNLQLEWDKDTDILSYNIMRSNSLDGEYVFIAQKYIYNNEIDPDKNNKFIDTNLTPGTTYYYKVAGINTSGIGTYSEVLQISTPLPTIPGNIENPYAASSDKAAVVTWDFAYDQKYKISKASDPTGPFNLIADNFDGIRFVDNTDIVNGTTYYYKVQGTNSLGLGPESKVLTATPTLGQHAKFSFDENNGLTAYDEWGGYHGKLYNSPEWDLGKYGSAVKLSEQDKSFVQLGDNIVSGLKDFTIVTWFKTSTLGYYRLFDFGQDSTTFMALIPQPKPGFSRFIIATPTGSNYDVLMPYGITTLNEWINVAITLEGTTFKYYINGKLEFTDNNCNHTPSDLGNTNKNYLGKSQFSTDPYTNHIYDDFRIYNYALGLNDIVKVYSNQTLAIEKVNKVASSIKVYPNPVKPGNEINILYDKKDMIDEIGTISIYNIAGQLISSEKINISSKISIKAPKSNGLYMLKIKTEKFSKTFKIIVE